MVNEDLTATDRYGAGVDGAGVRAMSDMQRWERDGAENGWEMPAASWWKRLPVIRHVRALYLNVQIARHNAFWSSLGMIPTGQDEWVVFGIWHGKERVL